MRTLRAHRSIRAKLAFPSQHRLWFVENSAMMKCLFAIPFITLLSSAGLAQGSSVSSGSGIVINAGDILTNFHVVDRCNKIEVKLPGERAEDAISIAQDPKNDLAVVRINTPAKAVASFRDGAPARVGDTVLALGYPLSGVLASSANLSVGIISALAGLGDDSRFLQISAPVQPGNSGGPLIDTSGHVVGIVTGKLNAIAVAAFTGDIPENINFAIKPEVAKAFLESRGIKYSTAASDRQMLTADIADLAKPFTAYIECERGLRPEQSVAVRSKQKEQFPQIAALPPRQPEPPVRSLEQRVLDFVGGLHATWSGQNSAAVSSLRAEYGDRILYYGKNKSFQEVLDEKVAFIARWPERIYRELPGAVTVRCEPTTDVCAVSGLLEWIATSGKKKSSGIARFEYGISTAGDFRIVVESGAVVKRYGSPESAKGRISFWTHNGSTLYLITDGSQRELRYYQPREGMLEAGARPDSVLFSGRSEGGGYIGTATIFRPPCGAFSYPVRGPIVDDYRRVVLQGQAPRVGGDCQVHGYLTDTLEFSLLRE